MKQGINVRNYIGCRLSSPLMVGLSVLPIYPWRHYGKVKRFVSVSALKVNLIVAAPKALYTHTHTQTHTHIETVLPIRHHHYTHIRYKALLLLILSVCLSV